MTKKLSMQEERSTYHLVTTNYDQFLEKWEQLGFKAGLKLDLGNPAHRLHLLSDDLDLPEGAMATIELGGEQTTIRREGGRTILITLVTRCADIEAPANSTKFAEHGTLAEPPAYAEFLLRMLSNPDHRDGIIGDLEQQFRQNCVCHGVARARRIYWTEVLRSILPMLRRSLSRLAVWGAVVSTVRRLLG